MLKIISLIITTLALQGCVWQTVDSYDIFRASKFCGGAGSIAEITATFAGGEWVTCYNGDKSNLTEASGATK